MHRRLSTSVMCAATGSVSALEIMAMHGVLTTEQRATASGLTIC